MVQRYQYDRYGQHDPPAYVATQRSLKMSVLDGETKSRPVVWELRRLAPWRSILASCLVQNAHAAGQLLIRVNDGAPTGLADVHRGDVRTIGARGEEMIEGVPIESIGARYVFNTAVSSDTDVTIQITGWTA